MRESIRKDKARIQIGRISNFGLLEMTRQRLRDSSIKWNAIITGVILSKNTGKKFNFSFW